MPVFELDYLVLVMLAFASLVGTLPSPSIPRTPCAPLDSALQVIARFPMWAGFNLAGDADHDGMPELYLWRTYEPVFALEHIGSNNFDTVPLPAEYPPWDIGDLDRDGKSDFITGTFDSAQVYESRCSASLPDTLVWTGAGDNQSAYAAFIDIDADSAREIALNRREPTRRAILECVGDNQYVEKGALVAPVGIQQPCLHLCQTEDMDGDGRPEVAGGTGGPWVTVFESPANDSYVCISVIRTLVNYGQARAVGFAHDMDGNGRDELICVGCQQNGDASIRVYEAVANDSFEPVWSDWAAGSYYGEMRVSVGDFDGDGVEDFAAASGIWAMLYRCTGPAEYSLVWRERCPYEGLTLYDVNSDGKDELIMTGHYETLVYEWLPVSIAEQERQRLEAVTLEPSVVRAGASVRLTGLPLGASVSVLDVSGRVVRADEGETVSTRGLRPGTYFLRVESGLHSIRRKFLVAG